MNREKPPRSFWPFGIMAFFALALVFLVTFVIWASRQREELVADNYYDHEIRYQEQFDQMQRTLPFEREVSVAYDAARDSISIALPAAQAAGATGQVELYRPSDPSLDRSLPLAVDAQGLQQLDAKPLVAGLWKVRVKWTTGGEAYYVDRPVVVAKNS